RSRSREEVPAPLPVHTDARAPLLRWKVLATARAQPRERAHEQHHSLPRHPERLTGLLRRLPHPEQHVNQGRVLLDLQRLTDRLVEVTLEQDRPDRADSAASDFTTAAVRANAAPSTSPALVAAGPRLSRIGISPFMPSRICGNTPVSTDAPSRPNAACTFASAPLNVEPDFNAAPPIPASMALRNVSKLILPCEANFTVSAADVP